jgi:hypothetical protein
MRIDCLAGRDRQRYYGSNRQDKAQLISGGAWSVFSAGFLWDIDGRAASGVGGSKGRAELYRAGGWFIRVWRSMFQVVRAQRRRSGGSAENCRDRLRCWRFFFIIAWLDDGRLRCRCWPPPISSTEWLRVRS